MTDHTNASPHPALQHRRGQMGRRLLKLLRIPESMMPEVLWSSERVGAVTTTLGLGSCRNSRNCRGSTGGTLWPALPQPRRRKKYLRNRLLPAAKHWRQIFAVAETTDHHAGLQPQQETGIRLRGQRLYRRRGSAVAARQPSPHSDFVRCRSTCRDRRQTATVLSSCRHSLASAHPTGILTPAACSLDCAAARSPDTSPAQPWKALRSR